MLRGLTDKLVTCAVHGQNEAWLFRLGFDLLPQVNDVRVDGASGWKSVIPPDFLEQTIAAQGFTLVADQIFQQLEFLGRKLQRLARAPDLAIAKIYLNLSER